MLRYFKLVTIFRDKHEPNRSVCDALHICFFNVFKVLFEKIEHIIIKNLFKKCNHIKHANNINFTIKIN